jgi:hypothetical protein
MTGMQRHGRAVYGAQRLSPWYKARSAYSLTVLAALLLPGRCGVGVPDRAARSVLVEFFVP